MWEELTWRETLTHGFKPLEAKVNEKSRVCLSVNEGYLGLRVIFRKRRGTSEPGDGVFALKGVVVL